jgi:hypothetical protein
MTATDILASRSINLGLHFDVADFYANPQSQTRVRIYQALFI